jgi:hypothetical protein
MSMPRATLTWKAKKLRVHGCQWGITLTDRDVPLGE